MTLLIDPPLLAMSGVVIERVVPGARLRDGLSVAATAVTLAAGVGFYRNAAWTRPLWPLLRISSGQQWMVDTWVLDLHRRLDAPTRDRVAAVSFAAYPLWLWLGRRAGRREGASALE